MTEKVAAFYCHGTAYLVNIFEIGLSVDMTLKVKWGNQPNVDNGTLMTVAGLNGRTALSDNSPQGDPFPQLLDPEVFEVFKPGYRALAYPMADSIAEGVNNTVNMINSLRPGRPFVLGGFSQGAAVMSGVYLSGLKPGTTGPLESRRSSFLGATVFGNPRRAPNHRGDVGGTWTGAWDDPGSNTGGHGSFPLTGSCKRLVDCEGKWVDFVNPGDMFSAAGSTETGLDWTEACKTFLTLDIVSIAGAFVNSALAGMVGLDGGMWDATQQAFSLGPMMNIVDGAGKGFSIGGGGHVMYPYLPPVNSSGVYPTTTEIINGQPHLKPVGDTAFQVALKYLHSAAEAYAVSPSVLPTTPTSTSTAGWTTTLIPPAA